MSDKKGPRKQSWKEWNKKQEADHLRKLFPGGEKLWAGATTTEEEDKINDILISTNPTTDEIRLVIEMVERGDLGRIRADSKEEALQKLFELLQSQSSPKISEV